MIKGQQHVVDFKSTEFQPRANSILVVYESPEKEVKTESGILIERKRSSLDRQTQGEVVAVGSEIDWISPGDVVVWAITDGMDLKMLDGEFLLLKEHSILGKSTKGIV